jgi:CRP/FNR family transcriptional regulator, cyclic AMP receptor protein
MESRCRCSNAPGHCARAHTSLPRQGLESWPVASVSTVVEHLAVGGPHWRVLGELAGLDEHTVRATLTPKRYSRGEVVFHEGDLAGALHLIDRGRVAVRLTTPAGDVATVNVLGAGDTFGEQALVDGIGERTATVTAIEPTDTLLFRRDSVAALRAQSPTVDRFFLMVLAARLQATSHQLLDALYLPADVRVLRCLARMHDTFRSDHDGTVPLAQADLASMAGVTRSTANRVLTRAQADGAIKVARNAIEILDIDQLRRRAELARPAVAPARSD